MKTAWIALAALLLAGCGGGGGGGSAATKTLTGRVLNVVTTSAPNPQAQVQVGSVTGLTSAFDGAFSLEVAPASNSLIVDTRSSLGVFTFTFPADSNATDVGDLYVGPEKIVVSGRVLDSTSFAAVPNATVRFAGRSATTDASGHYDIADVAYSSVSTTGFLGLTGTVQATGFFASTFGPNGLTATAGAVTFDDILLVPNSDNNPPPGPYTLFGKVSPTEFASGTSVTVFDGLSAVAHTTSGSDGFYYVWVAPGTYTVKAENGTHSLTLPAFALADGVILRKDVTLP